MRQKIRPGKDFEWSTSWTHNTFRLFEVIFGRKPGIRRESAAWSNIVDGKRKTVYAFYTWEAAVAHMEGVIRSKLKNFKLPKFEIPKIEVYALNMAAPGYMKAIPTGYLFAIARDNNHYQNSTVNPATSFSFSFTCTGSNLVLTNFCYSPTASDSAAMTSTYNAVSMTAVDNVTAGANTMKSFILVAPATGSNTILMNASSGFPLAMACISYSGAKQSGQPDSHNATSNASGDALSVSVTTVADNSWIAGFYYNGVAAGGFTASGAFVTLHAGAGNPASGDWNTMCSLDTNLAITPAGATSVGCSHGSGATAVLLTAIGISPAAVVADVPISRAFRNLLGVGR